MSKTITEKKDADRSQQHELDTERPPIPMTHDGSDYQEFVDASEQTLDRIDIGLVMLNGDSEEPSALGQLNRDFGLMRSRARGLQLTDIEQCAGESQSLIKLLAKSPSRPDATVLKVLTKVSKEMRAQIKTILPAMRSLRLLPRSKDVPLLLRALRLAATDAMLAQTEERVAAQVCEAPCQLPEVPHSDASLTISRQEYDTLASKVSELQDLASMMGDEALLQKEMAQGMRIHLHRLEQLVKDFNGLRERMGTATLATLAPHLKRCMQDAGNAEGKLVSVQLDGLDTPFGLDLASALKAPLGQLCTQLVSQCVQKPEDRKSSGKEPSTPIQVSAYAEAGLPCVTIQVEGVEMKDATLPAPLKQHLEGLGARLAVTCAKGLTQVTMDWTPVKGIRDID